MCTHTHTHTHTLLVLFLWRILTHLSKEDNSYLIPRPFQGLDIIDIPAQKIDVQYLTASKAVSTFKMLCVTSPADDKTK